MNLLDGQEWELFRSLTIFSLTVVDEPKNPGGNSMDQMGEIWVLCEKYDRWFTFCSNV